VSWRLVVPSMIAGAVVVYVLLGWLLFGFLSH